MKFTTYSFDQLSERQLHAIYQLRVAVFVVEQHCAYQEVDALDLTARHLLVTDDAGQLVAYARLMQEADQQARFGRIVVAPNARGKALGRQLVDHAIQQIRRQWPNTVQLNIQAQHYLDRFYRSFGFLPASTVYLEDGIPHQDMVLALS